MNRWLQAAILALPLAGLGAAIALHQQQSRNAQLWRIPVTGADPRDPLRGQYVEYAYAWQLAGDPALCLTATGCDLCLKRDGDAVIATVHPPGAQCRSRVDPAASGIRTVPGFGPDQPPVRHLARIYISESSAPAITAQLAAGPMLAVTRLQPRGRLTPRSLQPMPDRPDR